MPDVDDGKVLPGRTGRGRGWAKKIFLVILLLSLAGGAIFIRARFFQAQPEGPTQAAPVVLPIPERTEVLNQEPVITAEPSDALYRSESFRVGEIAVGGEASLVVPETDVTPLEILSVRGEAFSEKGKKGSKLVITWETSKPALSKISYGKGIEAAEGVIRENSYGTNHSLIVPDLAPASTYVYVISSRDKWGNTAESDPYAVYTGARDVSLFELIAGAIGDVFGWAVKK